MSPGPSTLGSEEPAGDERKARMAEAVRQVITRRERAPRSPRMERAFKRLIWRYTQDQDQDDTMKG